MGIRLVEYVPPPMGIAEIYDKDGDTWDIVAGIMKMDKEMASKRFLKKLAPLFKRATHEETLKAVYWSIKKHVKYKADAPGHEQIKASNWLLYNKIGDCKSLSICVADILRELGYKKIKYKFVSFLNHDPNPSHVYVTVVAGNKKYILDTVHKKFNDEVPYKYEKEISAA